MIGFIGTGSMGGAILRGVLASGTVKANDVRFTRKNAEKAHHLSQMLGVKSCTSNSQLVDELGDGAIVVLGVKPYMIAGVLDDIREVAESRSSVIVSVAAGTTLDDLARYTSPDQPLVRAMPNVASAIGAGMTALCTNNAVSPTDFARVMELFAAIGETIHLPEKDFPAFTAIAGCSPAWTFAYIDALSKAALAAGLTKDDSIRIAAQATLGSAQLALHQLADSGTRPQALIDTVTSPGGTTIAGLIALDRAGFTSSVISAVNAAIARDRELS